MDFQGQVAQSLSLGRATISDYFRRAEIVSLGWPLPNDLSDGDLERLLFPRSAGDVQGSYPQRIGLLSTVSFAGKG